MMPFSHILRKCEGGFKLTKSPEKINHLMYMDVIKLFFQNENELETLIQTMNIYSQDIGMKFGIEKYTMRIMRSGKRQLTKQTNQEKIRKLGEKYTYKYLIILEADTTKQKEMKEKIEK